MLIFSKRKQTNKQTNKKSPPQKKNKKKKNKKKNIKQTLIYPLASNRNGIYSPRIYETERDDYFILFVAN